MYTCFKISNQTWIMFIMFTFWWKANFKYVNIKYIVKYADMRKTAILWAFGSKEQVMLNFHICCHGWGFEVKVELTGVLSGGVDISEHRAAWQNGIARTWEAGESKMCMTEQASPGVRGRAAGEDHRSSKDGKRTAGKEREGYHGRDRQGGKLEITFGWGKRIKTTECFCKREDWKLECEAREGNLYSVWNELVFSEDTLKLFVIEETGSSCTGGWAPQGFSWVVHVASWWLHLWLS